MSVHRLAPQPALQFDLATAEGRESLTAEITPPGPTWMRAIMVTNSAGVTLDQSGTSAGLSKGDDRAILRLHRSISDAIVLGRRTLEKERIPVPPDTPVVTSAEAHERARHNLGALPHRIVVTPAPTDAGALAALIRDEVSGGRLLIEGGEQTWRLFAPKCDDIWLAVTPPPLSARAGLPPWWPADHLPLDDPAVYTDDSRMLYYHHQLRRGAPPKNTTESVLV